MSRSTLYAALVLVSYLTVASRAQGHFLWIEADETGSEKCAVRAGFGEVGAWDPEYAKNIANAQYGLLSESGTLEELKLAWSDDSQAYVAAVETSKSPAVVGKCVWGLFGQGGTSESLVVYYPKAMLGEPAEWKKAKANESAKVELIPVVEGKEVKIRVLVDGEPAADKVVKFYPESGDKIESKTEDKGEAAFPVSSGRYSVTCVHRLPAKGTHDGKAYEGEMHCATLTFRIP
jgi:uncharacterized GH25 family protein